MVDSVDPAQPFVYNDNLTIKIFATSNPSNILQASTFGNKARDYRIENEGRYITTSENDAHYITNFKTSKVPMELHSGDMENRQQLPFRKLHFQNGQVRSVVCYG